MKNLSVHIEMADNGVIVRACSSGGPGTVPDSYKEKNYVYPDLDDALSELPSIFSVMKEEKSDKYDKTMKRTADGKKEDEEMNKKIGGKN